MLDLAGILTYLITSINILNYLKIYYIDLYSRVLLLPNLIHLRYFHVYLYRVHLRNDRQHLKKEVRLFLVMKFFHWICKFFINFQQLPQKKGNDIFCSSALEDAFLSDVFCLRRTYLIEGDKFIYWIFLSLYLFAASGAS